MSHFVPPVRCFAKDFGPRSRSKMFKDSLGGYGGITGTVFCKSDEFDTVMGPTTNEEKVQFG